MREEFLHFLWKFKYFNQDSLKCTNGDLVRIIHGGQYNFDAGPDFENAKLQIGDKVWAGNVEIHLKSSDWKKHGHSGNKAYQNVILHVVYEHDMEIFLIEDKLPIPTLELRSRFNKSLLKKYQTLLQNSNSIACKKLIHSVDQLIIDQMMDRMMIERLQEKTEILSGILINNKGDWNRTFYQWLCRGYGLKVNAQSMLELSERLPHKFLSKHADDLFQLESLFFGVSGLLDDEISDYAQALSKEFTFLRGKYNLQSLNKVVWKFSKIRPSSFPGVRLAQFAALWKQEQNLFRKILEEERLQKLYDLLKVSPSEYWQKHYRFGINAKRPITEPGDAFIRGLIINVIAPFLFLYGKEKDQATFKLRSLKLLNEVKGENNKTTRKFEDLGFKIDSAYRSQSLIQLNNNYCELKKCLNCNIGIHLLRK